MNRFYTLIVILLVLNSWVHPVGAQDASTWMPDAKLRTAVRENLGLANGVALTQAKMLDLTSLHASRARIRNLTGLEHATNLTSLVAFQNQISSLTPLENLTSLTDLRMGNNDISDVTPLDDLTSLTRLGLQKNDISNVTPLAGLVNLKWLRLAGNPISDLSPLVTLVNVKDSDVDLPEPDTTAPSVSISVPSGTQNGAFNATIRFTETVSGFAQSDVSLSGSAAGITSWSANSANTVYTATITPTASGTVTIGVAANVATDAAGNNNTAATSKNVTVSVDTTAPGVAVSVPSGVQNGAFSVTITFTEEVSGFTQSEVSLSGSAAGITSWSANSANTVYTATITPTASGTVTIGVAANVATDAANNQNTAATSKNVTVSVDTTAPGVTVSVPSGTQNGAFNATITFTETVSGFVGSDVSLTGSAASITSWTSNPWNDVEHTVSITPTTSGQLTISVPAGVATDTAGNPNTASTPQTVTVDVDKPTVSIGVPSGTQTGAFDTTLTFSETVSGFAQSDVSLTGSAAGITSWSANSANTVYTATITPTASGTVTIGVAANVATDAAGNNNTAATSKNVTVSVDTTAPGVTVSVPSATQNGAFNVTITFTEAVSGFVGSDVSLSGSAASITSWSANSDDSVYTATITPTASGTVTVSVAANVATDAAGNNNTAATSKNVAVSVDTTAPSVTVSVPSGTQNGAFNATITFSETVSGFVGSDVSLTGSAAGITSWSANSNDTVYTATITPTASGTVTIGVAANVATDAANNPNTAATSKNVTVSVDTESPGVSIAAPSGVQTGAFNVTITFTEAVSGFVGSDVSLTGSAASITGWSANSDDTVYTATITPTASGTVTIGVAANVATDAAGNNNTAATSKNVAVSVDTTSPGVTVSVPSGTQNGAFNVTITFTETVSGFTQSDVSLTGSAASITGWSANSANTVYTATITPTASGTVTIGVAANVATDAVNNQNTAATSKTVTVDVDKPTVSIGVPSGTQTGAFDTTITFSETVSGFVQSDVSLTGSAASITSWSANSDDSVYTATITPTASGTVTIGVAANVATDSANNQNTAATSKNVTVSVDTTAPGVTVSVPSGTQNGAFNAIITFSETVSGFAQSDVSLSGSVASITSWSANSGNTVYTATITPTASGTVTIGVAANVATDAANNPNTAATSKNVAVSVDTESPGVSIAVPSGVQAGAFNVTITFTEAVSGFVGSDVSLTGSAASITSWSANSNDTVYTATITPTASGTVTIGVAANVATDAANNPNTAATSKNVTASVDTESPGVSIAVPSGVQTGAFNVTITFTEAVSGFVGSDVSLTGSAASITSWTSNPWNDVEHTVSITPTTSGQLTISVPAGVATDTAGNPNTASTPQTVTVDVDKPTVSIGVPSGTQTGAFDTTLTFSETVSGFAQSDVSLTGSAASITSWSANSDDTVYTATITPTASGTVTIGVAANVATDAANNQNTAATSKNVTVSVDTTAPGVTVSVPSGAQNGAFNATITFSETVSGFAQSDVSLTGSAASITGWSANSNDTVYTATITPTASGTVTVSVAADVATDAANNTNTAATSQTVTITLPETTPDPATWMPDANLRTAVRSALSLGNNDALTQAGMANLTTLTAKNAQISNLTGLEHATDLTRLDLRNNSISSITALSGLTELTKLLLAFNSITDNSITDAGPLSNLTELTFLSIRDNQIGSVTALGNLTKLKTLWIKNCGITDVSPLVTLSELETLRIAGNALTNAHLLGNLEDLNSVDIDIPDPPDTTAPGVSISVPSGTQTGAFDVTITFTKTVSGFVGSDVSLSGSASSITSWSANSDNTVYTATITPTTSGTVTIGVAANVATDAVNNQNTAATSKTVTASVDTESPGVSIAVPSATQNGAFNATITFTETVSGFVGSDVSLSGSAASITSWSANSDNTVYTATITPTASGTVTVSVAADVATDAANNPNTAATSQTVTITLPETTPDPATWMPDANLRTAVRSALGIASNANFSNADLSTLTSLRAVQVQVTNLTGLEYATGLTTLVAWGNRISSLTPIQNLTSLTDLRIGNNQISDVTPLDDLTSLTKLGMQHNNISNVTPLAGLVNLTWLRLAGNPISDLSPLVTLVKVTDSDVDLPEPDTTAPGVSISVPSGTQAGAFDATMTFSATVSGFGGSDVSLSGSSASITSWSANSDNTVYTATITPTTSGTVTIGVAANVATDAANNPNTAATPQTVNVDVGSPSVSITVPEEVQSGSFNVTILFNKPVSGFQGPPDISFAGSTATATINTVWISNLWNDVEHTVSITPTTSGQLTISVPAGVATDTAGNPNTASTPQTVTVDVDKPTVSIGVPSGTQTGAFDTTITFSETVSGFAQSDVSLSGSAASITGWSANSDDTVYTATITPTASGTVTIGVAANVATDAANNQNTAATSKNVTVSVDTTAPGVTVSVPSATQNGAFNVTITFTEAVSGFVGSDVSLTGSAARITSWSANSDSTVYTATITPTASGTVTIGVAANVATDAADNPNTAATSKNVSVLIDNQAPSVSISVPSGLQNGAFDATIAFTEAVSGFVQSEVSLTGSAASITSWSANSNNTVYTATITPTASGTVTIGVAANVAADDAGNNNTAATSKTVTVNIPAPTPDLATWMPDANLRTAVRSALGIASNANFSNADLSTLTSLRAVQVQVTNLTGLEYATGLTTLVAWGNRISSLTPIQNLTSLTDLRIGNNQISDVTPLDDLTSLTKLGMQHNNISNVTPLAGLVNLTWLRLAGNPISDLSPLVTLVKVTDSDVDLPEPDTTAPGVSISVPSGTQAGAFDATMTFSATVSGFVQADLTLSGTAAASITAWSTTDDITYTAEITPTLSGNVTLSIPAGVATDAANNPNTAATPQTVNVDVGSPSVSITVPEEVQSGSFNVTILFNKPVSGFQGPPDISFAGSTATATINTVWISNPWNDVEHTVSITPTTSGQLTISVPAGVATDTAGNPNTASTPQTVTVDVDKPTVSIGVPSGMQTGAFDTTITFSETVSGFAQSDVSLSGSAASITSWSANSDDTVYTATITPTASGTVTVSVAANVATDAANNQNAAATSKTVTASVDTESPGVSIAVPSGVQNGVFNITITFTETVSGFEGSEVSLTGSSASITSWSANSANTVYTATITPTASGAVTIGVAANVATDAANNQNTAATSKTVTTLVVQPEQVDTTSPSVTLTLLSEVENNRIDVQITFNEPVEGFGSTDLSITTNGLTQLDPTVTGGETIETPWGPITIPEQTIDPPPIVSITGWAPNPDKRTYTVYITTYTKTEGQVIINVPADVATDIDGNPNVAGSALSVDEEPEFYLFVYSLGPDEYLDQDYSGGCHVSRPERLRDYLDINEDGSIDEDDVALVEAALGQFGYGITNSRTDINCDNIVDNKDLALVDDTEGPTFSISVPTDTQSSSAFDIGISFNEIVFDFDVNDISLAGSTATATVTNRGYGWSTSGTVRYSFKVTPTTSGDLVISVPAGAAKDALDNQNTASGTHTVTVDMGIPSVSITSTSVESGVVKVIITFSKAVSGFEQADLSVSGADASITAWEAATDNTTFTATVTATTSGYVNCYVPAGVATDTDGRSNTASRLHSYRANLDPPSVEVSVPTEEQSGAFDVTITFSEQVWGFDQADVSLADSTAAATITDWTIKYPHSMLYGTTYEATITPTTSGTVVITIPANVATDTAYNGNTASNTHSITVSLPGSRLAPASLSGIVLDPTVLQTLDPEVLEAHLDILRAGSDGSLRYLQAIALIESILAEMRPEKTVLLANYPNPFNPETWIPYHLANDSELSITIYDVGGTVVRRLELGHQRAGHYTQRSRAAYWDGRNGSGEFVASGVYFYTLTADTFRATRKMLIGK